MNMAVISNRLTVCQLEQIVEAIKHGVRKVNIDTDLRLASTGAIRRFHGQKSC
jgi:fructose/tagatose bisphosphate aldolase